MGIESGISRLVANRHTHWPTKPLLTIFMRVAYNRYTSVQQFIVNMLLLVLLLLLL